MDRIWRLIFGNPDLGAVDFRTLLRRTQPNDALICPRDHCPHAAPDREPPAWPVAPEQLRAIVSAVARAEPGTSPLEDRGDQLRYLVRSRLFRFPDTVNVEIIGRPGGEATLALYSRSQIGRSDLGANRRRLERWLQEIDRRAAAQRPLTAERGDVTGKRVPSTPI
jgi:uncharacterized protein (DUF1499 family)